MRKTGPGDPETRSEDLVAKNIKDLARLFPEALSDGKVDFDVLRQLLGAAVGEAPEKYGLNWHGKKRARTIALTPSLGTLLPCPDESADWDTTRNVFVEGDNLEVLKLLQKAYAEKVRVIYIDPPYNTGKDFVYPDDFRDGIGNYLAITGQSEGGTRSSSNTEASGRFHTTWLNTLLPRLMLARTLLARRGVILLSIDDHEVANLRAVCDEVFGSENFVASLFWEKSRKNDAKLISAGHDYVLVYARSKADLDESGTIWREEKPGAREIWSEYVRLRSKHGSDDKAIELDLHAWFADLPKGHPSKKWSRYKRVDKHGPWRDDNISWPGGGGPTYDVVHPVTRQPCAVPERGWVYAEYATMQRMIALGVVEFRADHTEPPMRKSHLRPIPHELDGQSDGDLSDELEVDVEEPSAENADDELAVQVRGTYFYKQAQVTAKYMRRLMGRKVFDNPKDHTELAKLIAYVTPDDQNAIVMDFFAGSGSTGQAVWELNALDGGTRSFILVQLPQPLDSTKKEQKAAAAFCDSLGLPKTLAALTKERLRRAAAELSTRRTSDLGFRVFRLAESNLRAWSVRPDDLKHELLDNIANLRAGRDAQDLLMELMLKLGILPSERIETRTISRRKVFAVGGGVLIACLTEAIEAAEVEDLASGIVAWHKELALADPEATDIVVRDSAFTDDVAKTNFAAILEQAGVTRDRIRSV